MANYNLNNISEWPQTFRVLVMIGVFLLVFYGGYYFDLLNLSHHVLAEKEKENDLKQQIEIVIVKKASLENELAQLPALQHILDDWQAKLTKPRDLPELLHQILKTGVTNELQFVYFNPGTEHTEGVFSDQPIKIVVVGNYHQIAGFASQIANMPTIVTIKNFTIVKGDLDTSAGSPPPGTQSTAPNHLSAEFLLEVYHIDQK